MKIARTHFFTRRPIRRLIRSAAAALLFAAARFATGEGVENPRQAIPRDPFTPIGRTPAEGAAPQRPLEAPSTATEPGEQQWEEARRRVAVRGIIRRGERTMANVNGRVVGVGEQVEIREGDWIFRWRVETIGESGVTLQRLDYAKALPDGGDRPPAPPGSLNW